MDGPELVGAGGARRGGQVFTGPPIEVKSGLEPRHVEIGPVNDVAVRVPGHEVPQAAPVWFLLKARAGDPAAGRMGQGESLAGFALLLAFQEEADAGVVDFEPEQ